MGVENINELFMQWKEEKLGMERAIGQLLQYVAIQQTQLQAHEARLQRMAEQLATVSKPKLKAKPKPTTTTTARKA